MKDKVALITGAASGIGRATTLAFAAQGAKVVIADLDQKNGTKLANDILLNNGDALFVALDVTRAYQMQNLIDSTLNHFGALHFACNNAGIINKYSPIDQDDENAWDQVINTNLKGVWLGMKYQLPAILKSGGGAIVNLSSTYGKQGALPHQVDYAYVASKHGVIGITKSAALEYAQSPIRINAICPGPIDTPMFDKNSWEDEALIQKLNSVPMNRLGTPEEVAQAVIWLCSKESSYVTGHALAVDGGILAAS